MFTQDIDLEVSTDGANTPFTSRSGNGSLASEISSHGSKKSKAKATFKNKKSKNDSKEVVFLNSNTFIINYPFAKYLECGLKIDLTYAIDLTISNGNFKKDEKSFHSFNKENPYINCMKCFGDALGKHLARDGVVDLLGFGAKTTAA